MKTLSTCTFKNDKQISVLLLTEKEIAKRGFPKKDCFVLRFRHGEENLDIGMRPDEILMLIALLSKGLWGQRSF